jgi:hypothetical protein
MRSAGALVIGVGVKVLTGVSVTVGEGWLVLVGRKVGVSVRLAMTGVDVTAPITTGVGLTMDGVRVGGRKGVGCGRGFTPQPLHEARTAANRMNRAVFFKVLCIFSPPLHCIPLRAIV